VRVRRFGFKRRQHSLRPRCAPGLKRRHVSGLALSSASDLRLIEAELAREASDFVHRTRHEGCLKTKTPAEGTNALDQSGEPNEVAFRLLTMLIPQIRLLTDELRGRAEAPN